jgi:hypothetical protein
MRYFLYYDLIPKEKLKEFQPIISALYDTCGDTKDSPSYEHLIESLSSLDSKTVDTIKNIFETIQTQLDFFNSEFTEDQDLNLGAFRAYLLCPSTSPIEKTILQELSYFENSDRTSLQAFNTISLQRLNAAVDFATNNPQLVEQRRAILNRCKRATAEDIAFLVKRLNTANWTTFKDPVGRDFLTIMLDSLLIKQPHEKNEIIDAVIIATEEASQPFAHPLYAIDPNEPDLYDPMRSQDPKKATDYVETVYGHLLKALIDPTIIPLEKCPSLLAYKMYCSFVATDPQSAAEEIAQSAQNAESATTTAYQLKELIYETARAVHF